MQKTIPDVISISCSVQNGSSARQKFAASSSKRPFPAIDNSIFQVKLFGQLYVCLQKFSVGEYIIMPIFPLDF